MKVATKVVVSMQDNVRWLCLPFSIKDLGALDKNKLYRNKEHFLFYIQFVKLSEAGDMTDRYLGDLRPLLWLCAAFLLYLHFPAVEQSLLQAPKPFVPINPPRCPKDLSKKCFSVILEW